MLLDVRDTKNCAIYLPTRSYNELSTFKTSRRGIYKIADSNKMDSRSPNQSTSIEVEKSLLSFLVIAWSELLLKVICDLIQCYYTVAISNSLQIFEREGQK